MKKIIFFSVSLFVVLTSCKNEKQEQTSDIEQLRCLNCPKGTLDNDKSEYKSISFIKLETNKDCLITELKQMEMNDSLIFFLDYNQHLFIFNREGKFISQIGSKGNGPSEYVTLSTFFVDNKNGHVVIIDDVKSTFLTFDFKGKFLSSIRMPLENIRRAWQALMSDKNNLLLFNMMNMEDNMAYSVVSPNKGELKGKYFSYDPIKLNNYLYPFSNHPMVKAGDEIHFILPISDTIYSYSNSTFSTKYKIEVNQKMAKKEQIGYNTFNYSSELAKLSRDGYFPGFNAIFETDSKIFLDYASEGLMGYFLFDKQTGEGYKYEYSYYPPLKNLPFIRIVYSLPDDKLIGISHPDGLSAIIEDLVIENPSPSVRQLMELLENTSNDENPVLIVYQL